MFYGSGAGKLPTASAVAGDMVDAARHIGKVVTIFWNPEKFTLAPKEKMTHRFFVRMKSDAKDAKVFGDVEMIDAGIRGEIGFLTPVMSEGEFEEKAKGLGYHQHDPYGRLMSETGGKYHGYCVFGSGRCTGSGNLDCVC